MEGAKDNFVFHDLVLVGGGHAHVHVLKMWGMQPMPNVRVTLITRDLATPYSGMIPGYIAGRYTREECHLDLFRISVFADVKLIHAEVSKIDCTKKRIYCGDGRPPIRYDTLSIDIGIVPSLASAELSRHPHITPVKPIDRFASRWEAFLTKVSEQYHPNMRVKDSDNSTAVAGFEKVKILVAGGGAGGIEVALGVEHRVKQLGVPVEVTIINRGDKVMSSHGVAVQEMMIRTLESRGVKVVNNAELVKVLSPEEITQRGLNISMQWLESADGKLFPFDEAFWCTQAVAHSWLQGSGLDLDAHGFIKVDATLQSVNRPGVFAVGDCCHNVIHPRPKAGVFAVRAGPPLLRNIRKHIQQSFPLEEWEPQTEFLGIIGTGDGSAIASKGGLALQGEYLWKLKDKIDRIWMAQYQNLPVMDPSKRTLPENEIPGPPLTTTHKSLLDKAKMRCAGCGSKVGSTVLNRVIKRLQKHMRLNPSHLNSSLVSSNGVREAYTREDRVLAGIGDDAAVLQWPSTDASTPSPMVLVQTIDYFRSFVADPYLFGQIAANHALSDLHAMLARPYSALALCSVPYGAEAVTEEDLLQMLAGARKVLDQEDCALVGGHTSEGAESALGFALTGYVHPDGLKENTITSTLDGINAAGILYKGPVIPGHVLILTKALGTGVLLAAAMPHRNYVTSTEITTCYASMTQSNMVAAQILAQYGCVACTDVTGFGFLGHLVEMVRHQRKQQNLQENGESTQEEVGNTDDSEDEDTCVLLTPIQKAQMEALPIVRLRLSHIPMLPGAVKCSHQYQVSSSLFGANHRSAQQIINLEESQVTAHPSFSLLFDPQTSGGLLACVPRAAVDSLLADLHKAGYHRSAVIGEVLDNAEVQTLINQELHGVSSSRADLNGCVYLSA